MKRRGLIFDCDGTLVDSLGYALESFNYALSEIGEGPRTVDEIKRYFGLGADKIFTQLLGDSKKGLAAFESYIDHQSKLAVNMKLHDGIRDLLNLARSEKLLMGVVTGRHSRDMHIVLNPHQLSDHFQILVGDDHIQNSKPAPDGIILAMNKLGLQPNEVCYIGDSIVDIQAAHAAGCMAIAAVWDKHAQKEIMQNANPHFLANSPKDIWNFLNQN